MDALATPLPTLAWSVLVLGLVGQVIWICTNVRQPAMPAALYDCMVGAVGEICCGLMIIALAFWSPERVPDLLILVAFGMLIMPGLSIPWQSVPEPAHPMTAQWQRAIRRYFFRSQLCIAAGSALALTFAFPDPLQCGLIAVALLNLPYLRAYQQARASSEKAGSWRLLAPFVVPCAAWILFGWLYEVVPAGTDILFNDLYISVSDPIPTGDAATLRVLQLYFNLSVLFLLLALAIEQLGELLRFGHGARILAGWGTFWLRTGTIAGCFFYLPGLFESASALVIGSILMLVEVSVILAPSPVPASELDQEQSFKSTMPA